MKKALLLVVVLAVALTGAANASSTSRFGQTVKIERLQPVDRSGVHGFVLLRQLQRLRGFRVAPDSPGERERASRSPLGPSVRPR